MKTPPTEAQCFSVGRRCLTPAGVRSAYDLQSLYDRGYDGRGVTIAIVDSWGSDTIRHDLHVYDTAFGLPPMCGEKGVTCQPGMIYKLASDPGRYANDFYDVTTGNNQADPSIPGYPATPGWDPVTGLGTPDAARLLPDLVQAVNNP